MHSYWSLDVIRVSWNNHFPSNHMPCGFLKLSYSPSSNTRERVLNQPLLQRRNTSLPFVRWEPPFSWPTGLNGELKNSTSAVVFPPPMTF